MTKKSFILLIIGGLITLCLPTMAANHSLLIASSQVVDLTQNLNTIEPKPVSLEGSYQTAAICFLGSNCGNEGGFSSGGDDMSLDTSKQCLNEGFVRYNCNSVQEADGICPYNSSYIKGCKCKSGLITCPEGQVGVGDYCGNKYASCQCASYLVACSANQTGIGVSCGGKYRACVCKPEYQYNSSNCTSPRSVSGASCGTKYTGCSCPTGVSTGAYGCKEYYPSPCGSVCKVAYTDNCHIRTAVSTPYGCMSYFSDCPSKCERAYTDNCRNRTAVTATYGCQTYFSDCGSKCQIAYGDNCHNRTAAATPYGCQANWADCSSKCQTAYADNCRNRTEVSVPANATCSSYHSDCSSKCSAWACNSGYNQSGNTCVMAGCPTGWIDQTALDKCMPKKYQPYKIYDGTYRCWEASICASHIKTVNGKVCYEYQPIARLASTWHEENTYCGDCNMYGTYCDWCAMDEFYDASIGNGIISACSVYDK